MSVVGDLVESIVSAALPGQDSSRCCPATAAARPIETLLPLPSALAPIAPQHSALPKGVRPEQRRDSVLDRLAPSARARSTMLGRPSRNTRCSRSPHGGRRRARTVRPGEPRYAVLPTRRRARLGQRAGCRGRRAEFACWCRRTLRRAARIRRPMPVMAAIVGAAGPEPASPRRGRAKAAAARATEGLRCVGGALFMQAVRDERPRCCCRFDSEHWRSSSACPRPDALRAGHIDHIVLTASARAVPRARPWRRCTA